MGANHILEAASAAAPASIRSCRVNEVAVDIDLTLSGIDGRTLSDVSAHADSYSGSDTLVTAIDLVNSRRICWSRNSTTIIATSK